MDKDLVIASLKDTVKYAIDNLALRTNPKAKCATDIELVKYLKWNISKKGLAQSVEVIREINRITKK